jgi:flagellar protein FlaF
MNDDELSDVERDAYSLAQAAIMLDQARDDRQALSTALNNNLEIWFAIQVMATNPYKGNPLTPDVIENLVQLARYVAGTIYRHGPEIPPSALNSLININFQISQGLLEGEKKTKAGKA